MGVLLKQTGLASGLGFRVVERLVASGNVKLVSKEFVCSYITVLLPLRSSSSFSFQLPWKTGACWVRVGSVLLSFLHPGEKAEAAVPQAFLDLVCEKAVWLYYAGFPSQEPANW